MIRVAPSLLAADFACLESEVARITSADMLHIDVMDGRFVPNISFGPGVVAALRRRTSLFFDVHLMIEEPERYIETFAKAGADGITIHAESTRHIHRCLAMVRDFGLRPGLALNPGSPLEAIGPVMDDMGMVLLMTVDPGFGGQGLIPSTIAKVKAARRAIDASGRAILLQVDGGVNEETAALLVEAGADTLVSGVGVFRSPHPEEVIARLQSLGQ